MLNIFLFTFFCYLTIYDAAHIYFTKNIPSFSKKDH